MKKKIIIISVIVIVIIIIISLAVGIKRNSRGDMIIEELPGNEKEKWFDGVKNNTSEEIKRDHYVENAGIENKNIVVKDIQIKVDGEGLRSYLTAKLTNDSYFKDMIKYEDKYIIVGYGEETKSCVQTTMLKSGIIEHNILNDVTGPERYVYNSCTVYENKYDKSISGLKAIITRYLPVYRDDNGIYISKSDISAYQDFLL